jgi:hypothetical protein
MSGDLHEYEYQDGPFDATPERQPETSVSPSLRRMRSESIGKLIGALAAAQLEYKPIVKGVENTFYTTDKKKAMYADLSAIIAATQGALAKNGLAIIQSPIIDAERKRAGVSSLLAHSSGEWSEVEVLLPATAKTKIYDAAGKFTWGEKFDAQTCGIAVTYSRRYCYQSQAGVAAEEDDDANSIGEASGGGTKEAALGVAQRKVTELQAKKSAQAPKSTVDGPSELLGLVCKSSEQFRKDDTAKKRPFRKVEMLDAEDQLVTLYCFDNPSYGDSSLFNLLDMASEGKGQPCKFSIAYEKNFIVIKRPIAIGPVMFDDDGIPMVSRDKNA